LVLDSAVDGVRERTKPAFSAKLATLGYLLPVMRRVLAPAMERKGVREKKKYMARHQG